MPMLTFTTHARVKCAACHCDLMATWNEQYYTMEVTPCYDCLANAKRNALEDREMLAEYPIQYATYTQPLPPEKTYSSPLKFEPADEDSDTGERELKCRFCGQEMGDDEDGEPVTDDIHTRCRAAEKAEYMRDAKKDGGA